MRAKDRSDQTAISASLGKKRGYLDLKGYWEFAAQNRPQG